MLYFYVILFVILVSGVSAQNCTTVNATFTVSPRVCLPTYLTPISNAGDPTQADAIATFLNSRTTFPSKACVKSFSEFYCSQVYPECSADNSTVKKQCRSTCINFFTDCEEYRDIFENTAYPIPASCPAASYATSDCSTIPATNISSYFANCSAVDLSLINPTANQHICTPNYTVPVQYLNTTNYRLADEVFLTMRTLSDLFTQKNVDFSEDLYYCLKPFSNYYCSVALPPCPAGGSGNKTVLPICRDACYAVFYECQAIGMVSVFVDNAHLLVPSNATCDALPTTNCYTPSNNDTSLAFFFNGDPPQPFVTQAPTPSPTTAPTRGTGVVYPPRGPAVGGAIGAAVIVGLLLVIGITMIAMRSQDSR